MGTWFFATDLHGSVERYRKLFRAVAAERPKAVLLGGDLLEHWSVFPGELPDGGDFISGFLAPELAVLRDRLGTDYPDVLLILGNDDPRCVEPSLESGERVGLWRYIHERRVEVEGVPIYGYACVPPTPFGLKDWERYDVSRYVEPGCVSPEEGIRTVPVPASEIRNATIAADLERLAGEADLTGAVFLFHAPPYETPLDRAALDGRMVDHAPVDVHVGSIAVRRFIEARRPALTLHGHIHESVALTGSWKTQIGSTLCIGGAHDGPELALVRFDPGRPVEAVRELI